MNIFCHIDFDRADDCHLYIRKIIEDLADAAEDVKQSLRSALTAARRGDFHAMQIHLETAQSRLLPVVGKRLENIIQHRSDAPRREAK